MSVVVTQSANKWLIRLEREVDISCSGELKQSLLEAISAGKELQVDLRDATEIDITGIQLLLAAALQSEKAGVRLAVSGLPETVRQALREAGFEKPPFVSSGTASAKPQVNRAGDQR